MSPGDAISRETEAAEVSGFGRLAPFGPGVIGLARVTDNARALCEFTGLRKGSLRRSFLASLNAAQKHLVPETDEVALVFEHETPEKEALVRYLMATPEVPADIRFDPEARARIAHRTRAAFDLLRALDPGLCAGFEILVGGLLFARSSKDGGGGISDAIGAIWLGPGSDWDDVHYAEYLLHEYVHQCLFVEDMVRRIFAYPLEVLAREESLVMSAVTHRRRDYDKAFHSAFVGFALAQLQDRLGMAEHAAAFAEPLPITLEGLAQRADLLTEHGRNVLGELIGQVELRWS